MLEEPPPGAEGFRLPVASRLDLVLETDQGPQLVFDPVCLSLICHHCPDRAPKLLTRFLGGVRLQDSGLGLHDLRESPEGHAFPVRKRSPLAPEYELLVLVDSRRQLDDKSALTDSGNAYERDELRGVLCAGA